MKQPTEEMIGKVLWHVTMSLDGFIAGPDDGIGASLARQCLEAGLIDEILVHVAPILLGDGVRFFARKAGEQVALETIAVSQAEQLTNLRFRVRKA